MLMYATIGGVVLCGVLYLCGVMGLKNDEIKENSVDNSRKYVGCEYTNAIEEDKSEDLTK